MSNIYPISILTILSYLVGHTVSRLTMTVQGSTAIRKWRVVEKQALCLEGTFWRE